MAGITESKEVLSFILSLGKATSAALEDGDLSWSDAIKFIDPLKKLAPAIDNIEDVLVEMHDLDASEFHELVCYVQEEFDIDEDIEIFVEDAMNAGIELIKVIRFFK